MNIAPIGVLLPEVTPLSPSPEQEERVSQEFESILLRQFLSESMKPLLEGGPSGQVYGYLLTDSLAGSISHAGGLGLCSVLQAQLGDTHVQP